MTQQGPARPSTSFEAVEGNKGEQYNGATLLVSAYCILWVIVVAWIALVWRKQRALDDRLADLERVIDRAAAAHEDKAP